MGHLYPLYRIVEDRPLARKRGSFRERCATDRLFVCRGSPLGRAQLEISLDLYGLSCAQCPFTSLINRRLKYSFFLIRDCWREACGLEVVPVWASMQGARVR